MARPKSREARPKRRHVLFDNGVAALVFGLVCLVLPLVLSGAPAASRTFGEALLIPGVLGTALGVILLGLHALARRHPREAAPAQEPSVQTQPAHHTAVTRWSKQAFDAIDPRRFEAMCRLFFAQAGFEVRGRAADGNGDHWLHSMHAPGAAAVARCRHGAGKELGVEELREFQGFVRTQGLARGTYATAGTFGALAIRFAKANRINVLDRDRLLAVIATRTPRQQQELLAMACESGAGATGRGTRSSS